MMRNDQQPSTTRKFSVRNMRLGLMAVAMGMTGAAIASPAPQDATKAPAPAKSPAPAKHSRFSFQIGKASWYGGKFQGRKTASGEKFDMNAFTCAHRSLPLGSWIRVTNIANKKAVFLRVNDRGPVPENILLDLSYAAARKLGMLGMGRVKIEPVGEEEARNEPPVFDLSAPRMMRTDWSLKGMPILPLQIATR